MSTQKTTDYPIRDVDGTVAAIHRRVDGERGGKKFFWLTSDGTPSVSGKVKPAHLPLYRIDTISGAKVVIVTEGEKSADALAEHDFVAVGTVTGASSTPSDASLSRLVGFDVVLWPDHDDIGRAHMARIAERLASIASRVRVVTWGVEDGDDAADYFARGGTADGCRVLLDAARVIERPPDPVEDEEVDAPPSPGGNGKRVEKRVETLAERIKTACAMNQTSALNFFAAHGVSALKPNGPDGWYKGCAEWHGEGKAPAFGVHPATGSWCDHRDGEATGNLIEFLRARASLSDVDAAREVCKALGIEWREDTPAREEAKNAAEKMLAEGISKPEEEFDRAFLESCAHLGMADFGKVHAILEGRFKTKHKRKAFDLAVDEIRRAESKARRDYAASEGVVTFPEAGISGLVVPDGWAMQGDGSIWRRKVYPAREGERVLLIQACPSPAFIVGRQKDLSTGNHTVTLRWKKGESWTSAIVSRRTCMDARKIMELIDVGFDVTSETAGLVTSYLLAFEHANLVKMPKSYTSSRCMWVRDDDGLIGFMWGKTLIKVSTDRPDVIFHGGDQGDEQVAEALHARGTLAENLAGLNGIEKFPRVLLGLFASLCPPMLSILRASNFGIDWCGQTSRGKTTALMVFAHVWGNPDPNAGGYIGSWNTTRTAFERTLHVLGELPIPVDETKRGKDPAEMAQIVYDTINGRGRGRGSIAGLQRTQWARTVLGSTGETPLTAATNDGGTKARILSFWGSPFGDESEETAKTVPALGAHVRAHYGLIGPAFIRWVIANMDKEDEWREQFDAARKMRRDEAGANPVLGRLAEYVACIQFISQLAHKAIDFPWDPEDSLRAVEVAWNAAVDGADQSNVAKEALQYVCSEIARREEEFRGRRKAISLTAEVTAPPGGWLGKWDSEPGWDRICVSVVIVNRWLDEAKFDRSVTRSWSENGWTDTHASGKRTSMLVRCDGKPERMVVINRDAYEAMMKFDGDDDQPNE